MKCDMEEWENKSVYDPTRHMENFLSMIQIECVYVDIGHACYTPGKWILTGMCWGRFP